MPHKDPARHRAYQKAYQQRWYAENRDKRRHHVRERRLKIKRIYEDFKRGLCCTDCGFSGDECPWAIEFDHLEPVEKRRTIARMVSDGRSWDAILLEIEKCEPVCSNCHRIREHHRVKVLGGNNNKRRSRHPSAMRDNLRRRNQEKRSKREALSEEYGDRSEMPGPAPKPLGSYSDAAIRERIRARDEEE